MQSRLEPNTYPTSPSACYSHTARQRTLASTCRHRERLHLELDLRVVYTDSLVLLRLQQHYPTRMNSHSRVGWVSDELSDTFISPPAPERARTNGQTCLEFLQCHSQSFLISSDDRHVCTLLDELNCQRQSQPRRTAGDIAMLGSQTHELGRSDTCHENTHSTFR